MAPREVAGEVRADAAAGIASAQYELSYHLLGLGGDDNASAAIDLLVAAARQGFPPALFRLGLLHHFGRGEKLDRRAALPLIERAAQLGDEQAMRYAAAWFFDGPENEREPARGIGLLTALADRGSKEAAGILGLRLLKGGNLPADFAAAAHWLARSELGWAQLLLAALHAKGAGVERDVERARTLEQAALASATLEDQVEFAAQLVSAAPGLRDGEWALRVLEPVMQDPNNRSPMNLTVLAEVYVLLGRFAEAVSAQEEAIAELAYDAALERAYRASYEDRLATYRGFQAAQERLP